MSPTLGGYLTSIRLSCVSGGIRGSAFVKAVRVALVFLLLFQTPGCLETPLGGSPNLVLITVDTLRADFLECYGGPIGTGEALCQTLERGVRYDWAFSTAPYTVPSVASIHTSLYPSRHKLSQFSSDPMSEEVETLAEHLSRAGYQTGAFVSNPVIGGSRNLGQGFDVYDDTMNRTEMNRPGYSERTAVDTTEAALSWLGDVEGPWFLWIHYQDPHGPYQPPGAPPAVDAPGGGHPLEVSRNFLGYGRIPSYQALPGVRNIETYRDQYLAEIEYLNTSVSKLLAELEKRDPKAGILLTADHGEALGEDHYYFCHGHSLALDQIRVPLLWRPPGGTAAETRSAPVSLLDVAPTLLVSAGLPVPAAFEGQALEWARPEGSSNRVLFSEHPQRYATVVGNRYYAKDLGDLTRAGRDPNTMGRLRPLASRQAILGELVRGLPEYSDGAVAELDLLIDQAVSESAGVSSGSLDEATRDRLRALGYID